MDITISEDGWTAPLPSVTNSASGYAGCGDDLADTESDHYDECRHIEESDSPYHLAIDIGQMENGLEEKIGDMTADDLTSQWMDENDEVISSNHHQIVEHRLANWTEWYEFDHDHHMIHIQIRTASASSEDEITEDDFSRWEHMLVVITRDADGWLVAEHDADGSL